MFFSPPPFELLTQGRLATRGATVFSLWLIQSDTQALPTDAVLDLPTDSTALFAFQARAPPEGELCPLGPLPGWWGSSRRLARGDLAPELLVLMVTAVGALCLGSVRGLPAL